LSDGFVYQDEPILPPEDTVGLDYPQEEATTSTGAEDLHLNDEEGTSDFSWSPPVLRAGGEWYRKILMNLFAAAATYADPFPLIREGINILDQHWKTYNATHPDPKELQVIWWEFPREHWDPLRDGS
jgi:hypothetical protein